MRALKRPLLATICAAAAALGACKDSLSPGSDGGITITVGGTPQFTISRTGDGYPRANCDVSLTAQGSRIANVTWSDATFYWYTGLDRTKTKDSAIVSAAEIQASWDTTGISAYGEAAGGWQLSDGLPFDAEIVFRYTVAGSGGLKSTRVRLTCGPAVPAGTVAPPTVSQLTLLPSRDRWQPADSLYIQYDASSPSGVWFTEAQIRGAFTQDVAASESLQTTLQRVIPQRIIDLAALGQPLVVTVWAVDAFGQGSYQRIQTSPLVDLTPPVVQLQQVDGTSYTSTIGGTFFVGENIGFVPHVTDNHSLGAVVWHATPGTDGDSIPIHGGTEWGDFPRAVPVRADWGDSVQFRWYAMDSLGNVSDTLTTPAHAFRVYPTMVRPSITDSVGGPIDGTVIDTARAAVYVLQGRQHRIMVLSLATLEPTGTIALSGQPVSFDMTPGGDSLVVALHDNTLAVVDLRQPTAAPTLIALTAVDTLYQYPAQLRIAANDRAFVVMTAAEVYDDSLLEVNFAAGTQRIRADAGGPLTGITRSLDQRVLAVARDVCVERYDAATDTFGPCVATSPDVAVPAIDRTGQHFAIHLTAYDSSLAPLQTVQAYRDLSGWLVPSALSADGAYLYYGGAGEFIRARVSDGAILDRTVSGFSPWEMHLSPDGNSMLLTEDDQWAAWNHIVLVDLRDADAQVLQAARAPRALPMLTRAAARSAPAAVQRSPLVSPSVELRRASPPTARPLHRPPRTGAVPSRAPR